VPFLTYLASHAHEGDLPGTVDLRVAEGDDTAYGQALYPVPAEDPNDPLQWSQKKKIAILIICSLYSFLGNAATLGPSVYISIFAEEFHVTPTVASGLISYANLAYGFGSLLLVPAYLKFGRRPVMLFSMTMFVLGLLGSSQATTYSGLMAARIIHALGSGVCEALPVQLVNDIFFLHERGKRLGFYTVCLCWGSTGPLYAGYMLAGGYSWRLYFYVVFAFAATLLIATFFFVEESHYDRQVQSLSPSLSDHDLKKEGRTEHIEVAVAVIPPRKNFLQTLKPWNGINKDAEFFMTIARSFTYFLVPSVLWVIVSFGKLHQQDKRIPHDLTISPRHLHRPRRSCIQLHLSPPHHCAALQLERGKPPTSTRPILNSKLIPQTNSGLIALANIIGYGLAVPFTATSDRLAAYLTRKNGGIREAEMRLGVMLPAMIIGPAGLILYGMAAQVRLPWICYFVGVAMVDWASYWYFTFALAVSSNPLHSLSQDNGTFVEIMFTNPHFTVRRRLANSKHIRNAHRHEPRQAGHQFRHGFRSPDMDPDDWVRQRHCRRVCGDSDAQ